MVAAFSGGWAPNAIEKKEEVGCNSLRTSPLL